MALHSFTFAHLSDVHLDSWREKELKELNFRAFEQAISVCLGRKVDFVLISGDLYHTASPDMHVLAQSVAVLKRLVDACIPIYIIPGSHDFSYSQKTMLNVLENAGVFTNVVRGEMTSEGKLKLHFTPDQKTGVKIAGMLGKKGGMEKHYYEKLERGHLEKEEGFKIFMFHSGLEEYKPAHLKGMEALPLHLLPRNFDYYAGGHIHHPFHKDEGGYGKIVIPGAVFPVNYDELERHTCGKMWINTVESGKLTAECVDLEPKKVCCFDISVDGCSAADAEEHILTTLKVKESELEDKVVLLKVRGCLSSGKVADIGWKHIESIVMQKKAYVLKKNIHNLSTKEAEEYAVDTALNVGDIETKILQEHLSGENLGFDASALGREMLASLDQERGDSQTVQTFESAIQSLFSQLLSRHFKTPSEHTEKKEAQEPVKLFAT